MSDTTHAADAVNAAHSITLGQSFSDLSPAERDALLTLHPELARFLPVGTTRTAPDTTYAGAESLRARYADTAAELLVRRPWPSKSRAVALTELETAMMWGLRAYYGAPGEESDR